MTGDDEVKASLKGYLGEAVSAFLENRQMMETADYLARGRRFQAATADQLREQWVGAFKATFAADGGPNVDLSDLGVEFELRGIHPPVELVQADFEAAQERFRAAHEIMKAEGRLSQIGDDDPIMDFLREYIDPPKGN